MNNNEINSFGIPNWTYCSIEADLSMFKDFVGFIYEITLENGKSYIGRKSFYSVRKKHFGKKKIAEITDKRLKTYEIIKKESDWKSYIGSNKQLIDDVKSGVRIVKREIIHLCFTEKEMTYYENAFLFRQDVLLKPEYYNDNILGKFFRRDLKHG